MDEYAMTLKIFAGYEVTEEPWGGANNFLRSLYSELENKFNVKIVFTPSSDCQIFFFGQTGKGPLKSSAQYSLEEIKEISSFNPLAPVIMRMVNTRRHSSYRNYLSFMLNRKSREQDKLVISAANFCDSLIFQSQYQKSFMLKEGIRPKKSNIIYNGASRVFSEFEGDIPLLSNNDCIRIISTSVSTKDSKRHNFITTLAEQNNVEVIFIGTWPDSIPSGKVKLFGKLSHAEIVNLCATCHFFFHPGIKESCSNSIVEALSMGLPVLYGDGEGSSSELVNKNGSVLSQNGLNAAIDKLRILQPTLVKGLKNTKTFYTMERAASEYYNFFKTSILEKSKQVNN